MNEITPEDVRLERYMKLHRELKPKWHANIRKMRDSLAGLSQLIDENYADLEAYGTKTDLDEHNIRFRELMTRLSSGMQEFSQSHEDMIMAYVANAVNQMLEDSDEHT